MLRKTQGLRSEEANDYRDQAINLVNLYDGGYPHDQIEMYLDYYEMTREEFDLVIDRWTNKENYLKKDGYWEPKFSIK